MSVVSNLLDGMRSSFYRVSGRVDEADLIMTDVIADRIERSSQRIQRRIAGGAASIEKRFTASVFGYGVCNFGPEQRRQFEEAINPIAERCATAGVRMQYELQNGYADSDCFLAAKINVRFEPAQSPI